MPRSDERGSVVVGLSFGYHDAAAAVVIDGVVAAAAEQERFSRRKHDRDVPAGALEACLAELGLTGADVDHVVYYEKPLLLLSRYVATRQRQGPRVMPRFVREAPELLRHQLGVGFEVGRLLRRLGARRPPPLQFVEHHRSHAAAAFYPSPFDNAAVLTIDGIGEWATASIGHGTGNHLALLEELRFPHSLGLLYSLITTWCGFEPNDGEYKVMGLAPYGSPRFLGAIEEIATVRDDGGIVVDGRSVGWFGESVVRDPGLSDRFGGPPRPVDAPIGQREADLAASMQSFVESAVLATARRAAERTGERSLCLAGGVALNCVANGRLLREGPFDDIWVQPAAGDGGSAIGAALTYWHDVLHAPRPGQRELDGMSGAYLGPSTSEADACAALESERLSYDVIRAPDRLADLVAGRLADGALVGWVQGRMEFGPRALGNRSILADPRQVDARIRLNERVKRRESFRPFAPAVLEERVAEWFDSDRATPYMSVVAPVRAERRTPVEVEPDAIAARAAVPRSEIAACTHVDGSARLQTVSRRTNARFHGLISAFDRATGCPVLLNTSFNVAGEPIVASAADAVRTAVASGLDLLVIGDLVVDLPPRRP